MHVTSEYRAELLRNFLLIQNLELNWKYQTRWKCGSCNSQNLSKR